MFDNIKGEIILEIENIKVLENSEFDGILEKINIKGVIVNDLTGITRENLTELPFKLGMKGESISDNGKFYSMETMCEILSIMENIKNSIPKDATDLEKFMTVYKTLGMAADYDYSGCDGKEDDMNETRSIKCALIDGRAVCVGYALTLMHVLKYVGIDARCVSGLFIGETGKIGHEWNQVKIDGIWYNTDLTGDRNNIRNQDVLTYCLRSGEVFAKCYVPDDIVEECPIDGSKDEIQQALTKVCRELDECKEGFGKGYRNLVKEATQEDKADIIKKSTISVDDVAKMTENASALMEQEAISVMIKEMEHEQQKSNQMEK